MFQSSVLSIRSWQLIIASMAIVITSNVVQAQTLTITPNARIVSPGGSVQHQIKLALYGIPLANHQVYINDPVARVCTWRTTNALGQASYTNSFGSTIAAYNFVFYYGSTRVTSTVSVKPSSGYTLPNYQFGLTTTASPTNSTLMLGERVPGYSMGQSISTTSREAVKFGKEVIGSYLSNPGNQAKVAITAVSCATSALAPNPVTGVFCATGIKVIAKDLLHTSVIIVAKRMVDRMPWTTTAKQQMKVLIDSGNVAWSIASFEPELGFQLAETVSIAWDFNTTYGDIVSSGTTVRGASMAGCIAGSNRVLQLNVYKR